MLSRNFVVLNIESSDIRYLVLKGKRILDWGSVPLTPGLVRHGAIADSVALSSAIRALFDERRLPGNDVIASVTGLRSSLRVFSLPRLKRDLLEEAIRHEAEREMPVALDELYLSSQSLEARGAEQRFLVIGVPRDIVDTESRALALAGIRPQAIHLKPLALARAVNRRDAVIIDLEPDTFDLVVVSDGVPAIARTIVSRGEAPLLEDRIPQLTDELARTLVFHNSNHPDKPVDPADPVFLTGLLADDEHARELVRAAIVKPVETLAPPGKSARDLPPGQFAVNIGLARRRAVVANGAGPGAAPLSPAANPNVLPQRSELRPVSPAAMLFWVAAIGLAALAGFTYQSYDSGAMDVANISDELAVVNRQIDEMKEVAIATTAVIGDVEAEADGLREAREAMLAALDTSDLSGILRPAIDSMPSGIRITSISQTADRMSLSGNADTESSVAEYALVLERAGVLSKVQLSILSTTGGAVSFEITGETAARG